ncbi:zinc ABC transporter substrate-binding protein [Gilvimarinus chinensis]|uniref:zinc ABC transporter substrate-binding protein n=1 Tax=Gilvimarinus chinensis TaxID=396005 RepID=UPI00037133E0|nr:zinc ABC transporter substrate-binding protein [Gilvimarinus chinensis]
MSLVSILGRTLVRSLILFTLFASAAVRAEPLEVLASIKPLALIASELVAPDDRVSALLPPGVSPHAYAMRVSDRRALDQADVIVWVGPELESFLQKMLQSKSGQSLAAAEVTGVVWPEPRDEAHHHDHGHDHKHERDMHLWLNPVNAAAIAEALASRLAHLRPAKADFYRQRLVELATNLSELDHSLATQLQPVQDRGFAVYHDGYGHFVSRYQLTQVDFVTQTPEQSPGARHLYHLQEHLQQAATCLFVEPYADSQALSNMAQQLGLAVSTLDPLASAEHLDSYSALMQEMGNTFSACLTVE